MSEIVQFDHFRQRSRPVAILPAENILRSRPTKAERQERLLVWHNSLVHFTFYDQLERNNGVDFNPVITLSITTPTI